MNTKAFMEKASLKLSRTRLKLEKHSPEILIVGGIVGLVVSGVMACVATTKIDDVVTYTKESIDEIHETEKKVTTSEELEAIQKENAKALTTVYIRTGLSFAKLYGPSVALATASIASILMANNIVNKRNAALAAAYAVVSQDYDGYRKRVVERFGEAIDKELKMGYHKETVSEEITDLETGETKTVEKEINVKDHHVPSDYARCFDESSRCWEKDSEANLFFLKSEQNFANERLRTRGFVFLNEIYERLDLPLSKAGQVVGWVYDPENGKGDNYIDFGIYDLYDPEKRRFVNGYERSIWLDFNVDGPIYDLINDISKKK